MLSHVCIHSRRSYAPFYKMQYMSQVFPECICDVLPHSIIYYIILKMPFCVEAKTRCFCACIFKCKWAAAPRPLLQNRTEPLQLVPQIFCPPKKISLVLIIMSIALKSCVLNHSSWNFWYKAFWAHTSEALDPDRYGPLETDADIRE